MVIQAVPAATEGEVGTASLPRQRQAAETASLPCLISNNWDNTPECSPEVQEVIVRATLTSYQKKRAFSIMQNAEAFIQEHGIERIGFYTLTVPCGTTLKDAQRMRHNFRRRVLDSIFVAWMCVLEFQKNNTAHFHYLVVCKGDIRSGFNWLHYDAKRAWVKNGKKGPRPHGNQGRTPLLKELHETLNEAAFKYGFGNKSKTWSGMELTPIKKTAEAVAFYVGGYLAKSVAHKPAEAKGARFVSYSRGFHRRVKGDFAWVGPTSWLWREKLRSWAFSHGCQTMEEVKEKFGPKWAYHYRQAILEFKLHYWPTVEHFRLDEAERLHGYHFDEEGNQVRESWPSQVIPDGEVNITSTIHPDRDGITREVNWQALSRFPVERPEKMKPWVLPNMEEYVERVTHGRVEAAVPEVIHKHLPNKQFFDWLETEALNPGPGNVFQTPKPVLDETAFGVSEPPPISRWQARLRSMITKLKCRAAERKLQDLGIINKNLGPF